MSRPLEVLVVDDDPDILEVVSSLLEMEGYHVRTATNGSKALDLVGARLPDLILLDMRMPVMDGWEFHRHLLQMDCAGEIPVIVMSADQHAAQKAREIRAQGSLQKPFGVDELYQAVESLSRNG